MNIGKTDLTRDDHLFTLNVTAIAPTFGWTNVDLSRVEHITEPEDGIQEIILLAVPPTDFAPAAIQMFELSLKLEVESWFQGIRIVSSDNRQLITLRNPTKNKPPIGDSHIWIAPIGIREDKLLINAKYGGGCKPHSFQLNWDGIIKESFPVQVDLTLSHNDHEDPCKALITETLQFDLSTLDGFPNQKMNINLKTDHLEYVLPYVPKNSI